MLWTFKKAYLSYQTTKKNYNFRIQNKKSIILGRIGICKEI